MMGSMAGTEADRATDLTTPIVYGEARGFDTVVLGGFTAGVLDISDALIVSALRGVSPTRVLQYIASGVLGPSAFQGGLTTAALGLACHFLIAFTAAAVFFTLSRTWPVLVRRPVVSGMAFGLAVWATMQYVVVPLSLVRPGGGAPSALMLANALTIHALGVGLPIALFASRSARRHTR